MVAKYQDLVSYILHAVILRVEDLARRRLLVEWLRLSVKGRVTVDERVRTRFRRAWLEQCLEGLFDLHLA